MDRDTLKHILNTLRKGTITWNGRTECLRRARKKVFDGQLFKNGKPKWKYHWQCRKCKDWFNDVGMLEVDHIIEIGTEPKDLKEMAEYIGKMYCGQENLQALCQVCHKKKTVTANSTRIHSRKAPRQDEG